MIFAVMNENFVQNIIVADKDFANKVYPGSIDITDVDPQPSIGWTLENGLWIAPPPKPDPTFAS